MDADGRVIREIPARSLLDMLSGGGLLIDDHALIERPRHAHDPTNGVDACNIGGLASGSTRTRSSTS